MFSKEAKKYDSELNSYLESLFNKFMELSSNLPVNIFINPKTNRFNAFLFESVFYAFCVDNYRSRTLPDSTISKDKIVELNSNKEFESATFVGTTNTTNVNSRLYIAYKIFND